jgi:hypothetical protein
MSAFCLRLANICRVLAMPCTGYRCALSAHAGAGSGARQRSLPTTFAEHTDQPPVCLMSACHRPLLFSVTAALTLPALSCPDLPGLPRPLCAVLCCAVPSCAYHRVQTCLSHTPWRSIQCTGSGRCQQHLLSRKTSRRRPVTSRLSCQRSRTRTRTSTRRRTRGIKQTHTSSGRCDPDLLSCPVACRFPYLGVTYTRYKPSTAQDCWVGALGAVASTRSWRRGASYDRASKCVFMETHGNLTTRQLPLRCSLRHLCIVECGCRSN